MNQTPIETNPLMYKGIRLKRPLSPREQEALEELLRRKKIVASLAEYARSLGFEPAKHHLLIIEKLEKLAKKELDLLLIFCPPGSGKSTYVSVLFPSWYMANNPKDNYLAATHSSEFAARWGRKVRNDIRENHLVLDINVSDDVAAADRWALVQGGEYYGVGAGASISGFRADIAAIDDPFGSREDAFSAQVRQKRWDWYLDDFSSRLKPGGRRIVMATRWHEDDVSGKILQQLKQQNRAGIDPVRYEVISLPAIAEEDDQLGRKPGEYLWDEPPWNYGGYLRARQKEVSPLMWSALYQQRPAPEGGDFFKEEWLKDINTTEDVDTPNPKNLRIYAASDYATKTDEGDFTVHIVVGVDDKNRMFLVDLWRGRYSPDVWIDELVYMVKKYEPLEWGEEGGQIKAAIGPFLTKRLLEKGTYVYRKQYPTRGDKAIRAQSIRGRMAMQGLYVNTNAPYYHDFRAELLSFPAGKHDDQVDALSLIGQMLDHIVPADGPPEERAPQKFITVGGESTVTMDDMWKEARLDNNRYNVMRI